MTAGVQLRRTSIVDDALGFKPPGIYLIDRDPSRNGLKLVVLMESLMLSL